MLARAAARVGRLAPARPPPRAAAARGSSRGSRSRAIVLSSRSRRSTRIQHLATDRELTALLRRRRAHAGARRLARLRHLRARTRSFSAARTRPPAGAGRGRGSSTRRPAVRPNTRRAIDSTDALLTTTFHYRRCRPGPTARGRRSPRRCSSIGCSNPASSGAAGRHRPHPDRELGRLRRPAAGAADRAAHLPPPSWNDAPNSGRLPTAPTRQDKKTIVNCSVENLGDYPLDRIMSPDTMTADFQ